MTAPRPRGARSPLLSMRRILSTALVLCLLAPAAAAASGNTVIRDCTDDGRLGKRYSQKDYRDALANLPTDVDEYTDCRDVIRRAQLGAAGGGAGSGGSGPGASGSAAADDPLATATPQERAAVAAAAKAGGSTVRLTGGASVTPGAAGLAARAARSDLPTPLVVVLALLGAAALAGGGLAIRARVLARR